MFAKFVAVVAAVAGLASAQSQSTLTILSPGGPNLWWVADSTNTLSWTCHENTEFLNFTVQIANPTLNLLPQAIIAIEQNFDCSKEITQQQAALTPSTGYTVLLVNTLNGTDVYATSQEFEVKNLGAAYPATSATPTESLSSTSTSGTTSSTSGSSSGSSSSNSNGPNAALGLRSQNSLFAVVGSLIVGAVAATW